MPFCARQVTAGKLITLVFGKMNIVFHEECFILAEKTQSAGIANSLTGDTLYEFAGEMPHKKTSQRFYHFSKRIKMKIN